MMKRRLFLSNASFLGAAMAIGTPMTLFGKSTQLSDYELSEIQTLKREISINLMGQHNHQKITTNSKLNNYK